MCSFIFAFSEALNSNLLDEANKKIKSRGPDCTSLYDSSTQGGQVKAIHNLLDISGRSIKQPLRKCSGKPLFFNGEIYDLPKNATTDTEFLSEAFCAGRLVESVRASSGEFAICGFDERSLKLTLITDFIGTKPLFYAFDQTSICVASYRSAVEILGYTEVLAVPPNSVLEITRDILNREWKVTDTELYEVNLAQSVNSVQAWNESVFRAVRVRATHFKSKFFVPLSAGHDSGLICCALNKLEIPYTTVTLGKNENQKILKARVRRNIRKSCVEHIALPGLSWPEFDRVSSEMREILGDVLYCHLDGDRETPLKLHEDGGAIGLYIICQEMSKRGFNTMLSGSGGDEIYSDYGFNGTKLYTHSEFGGLFPDCLDNFFPWKKVFGDTQRSYLTKDEMVSGIFGIEGRYPLIDRKVIQDFLNTTVEIKNRRYKNVISDFLERYDYPVEERKAGFFPVCDDITVSQRVIRKLRALFKSR